MDPIQFDSLVERGREGDMTALDELLTGMRSQLRGVVRATRKRRAGLSLRTTEIFNEAYLKLFRVDVPEFNDEEHLLAMWSNATSWVVIEAWRRKGRRPVLEGDSDELLLGEHAGADVNPEWVERTFRELKESMPREGLAAELKLLGGQRTVDIAEALGVSEPTARRWIRTARAWIRAHLESIAAGEELP